MKRLFIGIMLLSVLVMPAFAYKYTTPKVSGTTGTINYTQGRNQNIMVICTSEVGNLMVVGNSYIAASSTDATQVGGGATYETIIYGPAATASIYKYESIKSIIITQTSTFPVTVSSTGEGVIATLEAGNKGIWRAFLLDGTTYNIPNYNIITSDAIDTERDIDTASKVIWLKCSDITTTESAIYQVSDDNSNWINGSVAITVMDNNSLRYLNTDKNARYMRLVISSTLETSGPPATVKGLLIY